MAAAKTSMTPYVLLLAGITLNAASTTLDGLVRGFCVGAGIAMLLISVAIFGAEHRRAKQSPGDGMWLPSRDEDLHEEEER